MRRTLLVVVVSFACTRSEDRLVSFENRIAELERKVSEHDRSVADLEEVKTERDAHEARMTAMQALQAKMGEDLAALRTQVGEQELHAAGGDPDVEAVQGGGATSKESEFVGVPECDEYISKYRQCIDDKVPEAARKSMNEAMAQTVKAWKEAASGPAAKGLAAACQAALDAAAQATAAMGCKW